MMERTTGAAIFGSPTAGVPGYPTPTGTPTGQNFVIVPRCTYQVERCDGGLRLSCRCDDKTAAAMVQNLCTMLQGGCVSCCVMFNGMTVCTCSLTMGLCKCESTKEGVSITCTSGDKKCCQMIQACCDCLTNMLQAGCTCCVLMNNTPVCCGSC
jgi:hypothetical protein